jgi:hypothetical protein
MQRGIKQEAVVEELPCNQYTPEQAIAKLRNIKNDGDNYDWRVHFPPKQGNLSRYPPALLCDVCGNLMAHASMTPCC